MTPHDLRAEVVRLFTGDDAPGMTLSLQSFSYKRGLPSGADMVIDLRFLRNPHWDPELRDLDGRDTRVADHVAADPRFGPVFDRLLDLVLTLLPAYLEEGKTNFVLGLGCTGGQHRSVAVAEQLGFALAESGWRVSTRHRELERRAGDGTRLKRGIGGP